MKKKRGVQLECTCSAYPFPHRLGGGRCDGSEWAGEQWMHGDQTVCSNCNERQHHGCNVADGLESLKYCEQYREQIWSRR